MSELFKLFWSDGREYIFHRDAVNKELVHLYAWDWTDSRFIGVEGATELTMEEATRIKKLMSDNFQ
jgi:hypothetical protein